MTKRPRTFAEFMRQAHKRGLPVDVLEDLARLERDGVEIEERAAVARPRAGSCRCSFGSATGSPMRPASTR